MSRLDYCNYLLSGMPQQLTDIIQKFTTFLQDSFLRTLNVPMLHHYWINYTGFQQLKELNIKFLPCAMTQSQKLSRLTCLIYFNGTPHPVYCVPLLIPAVFGFRKERKRFKGSYSSFPIWTLSNGIISPKLYYYILPCIQYKILLAFKSFSN